MKINIPVLAITLGLAMPLWAQSPSPTASTGTSAAARSTDSATSAVTDIYHVHFAKSAVGKAAEHGKSFEQDADAPMPGHFIVLRHQNGDTWDYCVIEHLGTKVTLDAARPAPSPAVVGLNEWHSDTYASGPAWAQFAKEMGLDDAAKSDKSAYVVSVYRPAAGQREALAKFLSEAPDPATDSTSGNVVLQHMEGAAWTFLRISRNNSWADFGKDTAAAVGAMSQADGGWFKIRDLVAYHTDTLCDRIAP